MTPQSPFSDILYLNIVLNIRTITVGSQI